MFLRLLYPDRESAERALARKDLPEISPAVCAELGLARLLPLTGSELSDYFTADPAVISYRQALFADLSRYPALTELLSDAGVSLMFDTIVTRPVMQGKHCKGLVVENKSGTGYYEADIVIDVTGDADVLYRAGVPCVQGKNYHTFTVKTVTLDSCKKAVESGKINHAIGGAAGGGSNLYGGGHPEDIPFYTGTDAADVNRYLITNHKELLDNLKKTDRFTREVVTMPGMCQYRTTRHIDGDYTLKESDFYRHFDDSISAICDFDRRDHLMEVPYRTLICSGYDNLITAGRSAAAEGYAWDVLRVIPPAIITGQAAGVAAALSSAQKTTPRALGARAVQQKLTQLGAKLFD
jgi:hypothetical protein